jgi:predicted RNA binding protein YcfA (HicA-like mRNA interferase family)
VAAVYDRGVAEAALAELRLRRRSATPECMANVCEALGFTIDKQRGKGSHWLATRARTRPIVIPTGNKTLGLRTVTGIVRRLEEIFDDDQR